MRHSLYLAWRYGRFHPGKTLVLITALTLMTYVPLVVHMMVHTTEARLLARAEDTPLLIGPKGSGLDLVFHALYFTMPPPATIALSEARRAEDMSLAMVIPLYARFTARGYPIVGTTLDYFAYRALHLQTGRPLALLGECVLGATVAAALGLRPGDSLVSTPDNLFDLAGSYPLKMRVVGVLQPTQSADDLAVFVDLKTAWIIAGLGHGHQEPAGTPAPQAQRTPPQAHSVTNTPLQPYVEITAENLEAFHFHGDMGHFPLTAMMAVPHDHKAATLLRGRYVAEESVLQAVLPSQVVAGLLRNIFQMKRIFDTLFAVVSVAMLLTMGLILTLSLRLRQPEVDLMCKLGCGRRKIIELLAAEMAVIVLISLVLTAGLAAATTHWQAELWQRLLFSS